MLFGSHQFLLIFATRAGTISMNFTNAGIGAGCEGLSWVIQIRHVHGLCRGWKNIDDDFYENVCWIFSETRIVFPTEVYRTLSKNTAEQATLPEEEVSGENKENIRHPKYKHNLVKVKGKDVCGQKTVTEYRKDIGTSDTALEEMVT